MAEKRTHQTNKKSTYKVDGHRRVMRKVGLAVEGQEVEALSLGGELGLELLR